MIRRHLHYLGGNIIYYKGMYHYYYRLIEERRRRIIIFNINVGGTSGEMKSEGRIKIEKSTGACGIWQKILCLLRSRRPPLAMRDRESQSK